MGAPADEILARLRAATAPVSGEALAEQLGMSRAAVFKHVEALRTRGYAIAAGRGGAAARLVLEAKSAQPGAEVLHHAGIDMDAFDEWCSRASGAVAAWSEFCPERADAHRVRAILEKGYDATENAVTELLGLMGLRLPEESSPSSVDLQGEFKANAPDDPQKRGLFRRKRA